jgi:hypothetical protein
MGRSVGAALAGLGFLAVLVVLQYMAGRFIRLIERFHRATPVPMALSAVPDCFALFHAAMGLIALLALSLLAAQSGRISLVLPGVAAFIVCQFMAVAALNPASLGITVTTEASANEEAMGNLVFFLKVLIRLVPVAFGVGVAWGVAQLVLAYVLLFGGGGEVQLPPPLSSDEMRPPVVTAMEVAGFTPQPMRVVATGLAAGQAGALLVVAAALPVVGYALLLLAHLGLEVLRGLVLLPERLEQLGEPKEEP